MTYLLLQTFLLLLASYFLGAFVACMTKRAFFGAQEEIPAHVLAPAEADLSGRPIVVPPQPVRIRPVQPVTQPIAPRAIDPVQPKIEVLRRPDPRIVSAVLDPSRFERALIGPDFNEGVPRIAVIEIRPSVLPPVTYDYVPMPPEPPPPPPVIEEPLPEIPVVDYVVELPEPEAEPVPEPPISEPRRGGLAARLRDATTAAAAGAVAAAKAAAAASIAMPGLGSSRRAPVEEPVEEKPANLEDVHEPEHTPPFDIRDADHEVPAQREEDFSREPPELLDEEPEETAVEPEPEFEPEPEEEPEPERTFQREPEPALQPQSEPVFQAPIIPAALTEGGDDFQRIRAIDGDIEQRLKARGITYFEHIAGWSSSDVKRIGQELQIPGRIDREQWVEQAQILAKGGETYYSRNRKATMKSRAVAPTLETVTFKDQSGTSPSARALAPANVGADAQAEDSSGVAGASQGRSVAEMAVAAAAAIAAASASVTRGLKPIEPISPLSKVDPKISMPARITDAIRERETSTASVEIKKESAPSNAGAEGPTDDLKRIRGIGVLIEKRLNAMGIYRYDQIANWTSGDIDRVSRMLEFKGRIERESWVEQARILASGGQTEFSGRVDRGEVDTSRES